MDLYADVSLWRDVWLAGVKPHPNSYRPVGERLLRLGRGRDRLSCVGARDEKRIALRVDLDAAVRRERISKSAPMGCERVAVALGPELVKDGRRALDVGQQESAVPVGRSSRISVVYQTPCRQVPLSRAVERSSASSATTAAFTRLSRRPSSQALANASSPSRSRADASVRWIS